MAKLFTAEKLQRATGNQSRFLVQSVKEYY